MPFFKFHFVEASRMAGIQYEGKELQSGKRMTWHVSCIFSSDEGVITADDRMPA